jgi:hypothetical protein
MNLSFAQTRRFHAHSTARMDTLNGTALATFWQRLIGFFIDLFVVLVLWMALEFAWRRYLLHQSQIDLHWDFHEVGNIAVVECIGDWPTTMATDRQPASGLYEPGCCL